MCGGADMRIMQNDLPAPVTQRLEWLESDSAAQRTAILKLERDFKLVCYVVAVVFAALGIERIFL